MGQEAKRKIVHISMVAWALLIGRVPPWAIVLLALFALLHNIFVLPRITGGALERSHEKASGYSMGMLVYPAVILLLSIVFYDRQVIVAIAWGIMAFGDGFAGVFGPVLRGPAWKWSPDKRLGGSLAFVVLGAAGTIGLLMLLPKEAFMGIPFAWYIYVVFFAAIAAAIMETVPGLVDDNLSVPITAAVVSYVFIQITQYPIRPDDLGLAIVFISLLTVVSIAAKKIDLVGGIAGFFIALGIYAGGGFPCLSLLFAFFFIGSFVSRWRMKDKEKLGLAQEDKGTRSLRHALANGGAAAACGISAWLLPDQAVMFAAMAAGSLASAAADTCSSELGNVYGQKFFDVVTFKPGQRGLDGLISIEGTILGAAAALVMGSVYFAWGVPIKIVLMVVVAGIFGNYIDSVLGSLLQRRGFMTNDTVNAANTFSAALSVMVMFHLLGG